MNAIKRLCTYFCSSEIEDLNSLTKSLQDLPLEIIMYIFGFIPPAQTTLLRNECKIFRSAVALNMRGILRDIRIQIRSQVYRIHTKLQNIVENHKFFCNLTLIKTFMGWRILQMDVSLLYVMVWRYSNDLPIWSSLIQLIGPIIEEIDEEMKALSKNEWKLTHIKLKHPLLENFIEKFSDDIEVHFFNSDKWASFELKLIDLMLCCPCGNLKMIYTKLNKTDNLKRIDMFFELMNTKEKVSLPNIKPEYTRYQNEREILRFMREYIRKTNISLVNSVIKTLKDLISMNEFMNSAINQLLEFIYFGDESSITVEKKKLSNNEYQEIHERCTSMNVGRCGISSSFETKNEATGAVFFNENSSANMQEMNGRCYACLRPSVNNAFTLSILTEQNKNTSIKEILIVFEPEKNNYSMSAFKHTL